MKKITVVLALLLFGAALMGTFQHSNPGTHLAGLTGSADVGGKLAYSRGGALWLYSGGDQHRLTNGPRDKQDKRDAMPAFSPDGSEVVYTRFDEGYSDLYKLEVANPSETVALTDHKPPVPTGYIDPTGGHRGYSDLALWALYATFSPDGQTLAYTTDIGVEYPGLFFMNPNGNNERRISLLDHSKQAVEHPSWAPNGSKIAVTNYVDTRNGQGQIWALNIATRKWTELTDAKDGAYDPAWSPNGNWIAFTMRDGTAHNIYIVPTDPEKWTGDHPTPVKLTEEGASRTPVWSPDGSKLAYISLKDGSFDLFSSDFNTTAAGQPTLTNPQKLTDKANIDAASGLSWGR